ncbi:MAG: DUF86 domain-containing protein [Bacteroidales bacterium]|nr:DUF86 domain-containing protein [Bacteroidales bacterium]
MRDPIRDKGRLEHILAAIDNVFEFTEGVTYEDLIDNKLVYQATVHNVQIIGEAAYKLTQEFKDSHPELCWKDIITMRHILVHDYYTIEPTILWNVIHEDLPPFRVQICKYLAESE